MKREKIFKKACKGSSIQIINNTYVDKNGELHTRNQWVNLGGAAYVIDFPRTLNENEILCLAGVPSEKVCEGFVRFIRGLELDELGLVLSDNSDDDILLDRCNFVINGKFALFRTANSAPLDISIFLNEEDLALIDDEKEVEFFLREYGGESPCVIAKNGFMAIAVFLPFKFYKDSDQAIDKTLKDNALTAYKIISGGRNNGT